MLPFLLPSILPCLGSFRKCKSYSNYIYQLSHEALCIFVQLEVSPSTISVFQSVKYFLKQFPYINFQRTKIRNVVYLWIRLFVYLKEEKLKQLEHNICVFLGNSCPAFRCIHADCFVPRNDSVGCHCNQGYG